VVHCVVVDNGQYYSPFRSSVSLLMFQPSKRPMGRQYAAPALTSETLAKNSSGDKEGGTVNKQLAQDCLYRNLAPVDQDVGKLMSVLFPLKHYERCRNMFDHWRDHSQIGSLGKTKRQCFTMKGPGYWILHPGQNIKKTRGSTRL